MTHPTSIDDKLQILRDVARDFMNRDGLRQQRVLDLIEELDEQIAREVKEAGETVHASTLPSFTFMVTEQESLNELSPIEVLHGVPAKERTALEACQQRMLDYPAVERYRKVETLLRLEMLEQEATAPAVDIAAFGELIDAYQCAQKDGSHDDRAQARIALMQAYRALLSASKPAAPHQPTEAMLNAARDWSVKKYGQGIGNDAAIGCWQAMLAASPAGEPVALTAERVIDESHNHFGIYPADDINRLAFEARMRTIAAPQPSQPAKSGEPVGYLMRHKATGSDTGFSWRKDDPLFSSDWERVPLYAAPQPSQPAPAVQDDERAAFEAWISNLEGHPFAGRFANLMWKAWQARASYTQSPINGEASGEPWWHALAAAADAVGKSADVWRGFGIQDAKVCVDAYLSAKEGSK